jgi:sporulation protein YlmC with PRC-barrel domain
VAVHNQLVTDRDLVIQVAQALARDKRTRYLILPVNAVHGWIQLGGEVPTRELQRVAEKVAAGVPGVRGVITLPNVTGESPIIPRRVVQPGVGATVYGENGEVGVVTQVVIQPDNRLVTHVVVCSNELRDINLVAREYVVPVKAFDLVKNESIILQRNGRRLANPALALEAFPTFDPDEFPLAPFTWKAPYPYTAGEVRWSLREILEAESQPGSQPGTKAGMGIEMAPDSMMAQSCAYAVSTR